MLITAITKMKFWSEKEACLHKRVMEHSVLADSEILRKMCCGLLLTSLART